MPPQDAATATVGDRLSTDGGLDRRLLIDGRLVATERVFASVNPATGKMVVRCYVHDRCFKHVTA